MSTSQDGGPAFPQVRRVWDEDCQAWAVSSTGGMTLRDWFAGMALQGYLAGRNHVGEKAADCFLRDQVAKQCFGYADAMLAARDGKEGA